MGAAPQVSVLMPVRDAESTLTEAIASLEAQTLEDFEVIAVDDGSSDGSGQLLRSWAKRDPRVRVVRQGPTGIVAALERARAVAGGVFLARMDADDVSEPTRLEKQCALLEREPRAVLCGCRVRYFPRPRVRAGARRYEVWLNAPASPAELDREVFVECPLAHPTFFMRAAAVDAVGGYRDDGVPEDYDLLLRLWIAHGPGSLATVPEVLHHWREAPDRLSRTDARYGADAFRRCKVAHLPAALPHIRDGAVVWGAGPVGKAFARALQAASVPVRAFAEVDPRKLGQEIHGAPVLDAPAALALDRYVHLAAVGQAGARGRIRELMEASGRRETHDFVAVA